MRFEATEISSLNVHLARQEHGYDPFDPLRIPIEYLEIAPTWVAKY